MSMSGRRNVLLTNVLAYAGPGALPALVAQGCRVACHDPAFAQESERRAFQAAWPDAVPLGASGAEVAAGEAAASVGELDAVVSNAAYPITPRPIEDIDVADLRGTFEAVMVEPRVSDTHSAQELLDVRGRPCGPGRKPFYKAEAVPKPARCDII